MWTPQIEGCINLAGENIRSGQLKAKWMNIGGNHVKYRSRGRQLYGELSSKWTQKYDAVLLIDRQGV